MTRIAGLLSVALGLVVWATGAAVAARAADRTATAIHAACPANLASSLSVARTARQLVTVVAPTRASTLAGLTVWQRSGRCWRPVAGPWEARLGAGGLSAHRTEGDRTTPVGTFPIGSTIYGSAPDPGVRYAYHRLVCGDWWDEDPASPTYNSFQHVPCGTRPAFGGASEALWKAIRAYQHFLVIGFNLRPVVPGKGSGIFLHADRGHPTVGCISLPPARLVKLLRWLRPDAGPLFVIGTRDDLRRL